MTMDDDAPLRPSRSERKQEAEDLQKLGEALVALSADRLREVPMSDDLAEAVRLARQITARGGRRRQLQLIGKLMRQEDPAPIREALARFDNQSAAAIAEHHQAERWRERLLNEGDEALAAFLAEHPTADRQRLRQLVRAAAQEQAAGQPPKSAREIYRMVKRALADG